MEPQPGLALLRLAEGKAWDAAATIRRVVGETTQPFTRAGLVPAYVGIMLAVGDVEQARMAHVELAEIAERQGNDMLGAMAAQARGAVALAEGDPHAALAALREALVVWQELGVAPRPARSLSHTSSSEPRAWSELTTRPAGRQVG